MLVLHHCYCYYYYYCYNAEKNVIIILLPRTRASTYVFNFCVFKGGYIEIYTHCKRTRALHSLAEALDMHNVKGYVTGCILLLLLLYGSVVEWSRHNIKICTC